MSDGKFLEPYPCDEDGNPIVPESALETAAQKVARAHVLELAAQANPADRQSRLRAISQMLREVDGWNTKRHAKVLVEFWGLSRTAVVNDIDSAAHINRMVADQAEAMREFMAANAEQRELSRRVLGSTARHVSAVLDGAQEGEIRSSSLRDLTQAFAQASDAAGKPLESMAKVTGLITGERVNFQVMNVVQSGEVQGVVDAILSVMCPECLARAAEVMGNDADD